MFLLTLFVLILLLHRVSKQSGDKNSVRLGTVLEWETENMGGHSPDYWAVCSLYAYWKMSLANENKVGKPPS